MQIFFKNTWEISDSAMQDSIYHVQYLDVGLLTSFPLTSLKCITTDTSC